MAIIVIIIIIIIMTSTIIVTAQSLSSFQEHLTASRT